MNERMNLDANFPNHWQNKKELINTHLTCFGFADSLFVGLPEAEMYGKKQATLHEITHEIKKLCVAIQTESLRQVPWAGHCYNVCTLTVAKANHVVHTTAYAH